MITKEDPKIKGDAEDKIKAASTHSPPISRLEERNNGQP